MIIVLLSCRYIMIMVLPKKKIGKISKERNERRKEMWREGRERKREGGKRKTWKEGGRNIL